MLLSSFGGFRLIFGNNSHVCTMQLETLDHFMRRQQAAARKAQAELAHSKVKRRRWR